MAVLAHAKTAPPAASYYLGTAPAGTFCIFACDLQASYAGATCHGVPYAPACPLRPDLPAGDCLRRRAGHPQPGRRCALAGADRLPGLSPRPGPAAVERHSRTRRCRAARRRTGDHRQQQHRALSQPAATAWSSASVDSPDALLDAAQAQHAQGLRLFVVNAPADDPAPTQRRAARQPAVQRRQPG